MPELFYSKGLENVAADESRICFIDGEKGILRYCGYPVEELGVKSSFEETAYLLLKERLPKRSELEEFSQVLKKNRKLPPEVMSLIQGFPQGAHPMMALQASVSILGMFGESPVSPPVDRARQIAIVLMAQFPALIAAIYRRSQGLAVITPTDKFNYAGQFLYLCTGQEPDPLSVEIFDRSLVLHMEHSFNASTFAGRCVASTLASFHASIASAVGALYGPLHGGANEGVLKMIAEIGSEANAERWVLETLQKGKKIIGMGHRVYRTKDPRSYVLEEMLAKLAQHKGGCPEFSILKKIEAVVGREMKKKNKQVWPNVDFFSGALYKLLGLPVILFTPIFALARIAGWSAHIIELWENNRLYRPDVRYIGPDAQKYIPVEQRT